MKKPDMTSWDEPGVSIQCIEEPSKNEVNKEYEFIKSVIILLILWCVLLTIKITFGGNP